jgi:hypothetical protein
MNEKLLLEAVNKALSQLGVPEVGYTGRVAEAIETLQNAVAAYENPNPKQRKVKNIGTETSS